MPDEAMPSTTQREAGEQEQQVSDRHSADEPLQHAAKHGVLAP
jgi:hypothetical protein